jgi:hypothetical protein
MIWSRFGWGDAVSVRGKFGTGRSPGFDFDCLVLY